MFLSSLFAFLSSLFGFKLLVVFLLSPYLHLLVPPDPYAPCYFQSFPCLFLFSLMLLLPGSFTIIVRASAPFPSLSFFCPLLLGFCFLLFCACSFLLYYCPLSSLS